MRATEIEMEAPPATGFLAQYDAIEKSGLPPQDVATLQVGLLMQWIFGRSAELFAELRAARPILVTPGPVLISRHDDVKTVAEHDEFTVQPYGVSMRRYNGGPNFLLGMDDQAEHARDRALLRAAMSRADLGALRASSAEVSGALVAQARASGQFELTDGYARMVPALVMNRYYYGTSAPDAASIMRWSRDMYRDIFFNLADDARVTAVGMAAAAEFRACVDGLVASSGAGDDTVLGRLLAQDRFSPARISDNLIGCTVGVVDNIGNAFVNAVDYLLDHPEHLRGAADAVHDDELILRYILEALRFHPTASILVRYTNADTTLGDVAIPANRLVLASSGSAMMDEDAVSAPETFDLERPWEHYLHFGWGMHECFGRHIACAQLTEMLKVILTLPNLRRAHGEDGMLTYADGFPRPFVVAFDTESSAA